MRKGAIVQRCTASKNSWTKARKAKFLAGLAESCNVKASCRALGLAASNAYRRRVRDPDFAAQWEWALQQGYVRLEGELLAHAIGDDPTDDPIADMADAVAEVQENRAPMPFNPELALKLLAQRANTDSRGRRHPGRPFAQPTTAEVMAALERKLTTMEKRLRKGEVSAAEPAAATEA
jgi:hypothetical protein